MISQADLHSITDRIGKEMNYLRTYVGSEVDTVVGATDICESLWKCWEDIRDGGDKDAIADLLSSFDNIQLTMDWENLARARYAPLIYAINSHLKARIDTSFSGYSYFATQNSGTRYCSEFCRLLTLCGVVLAGDPHGFYDGTDSLGTHTLTGAGVGDWVASAFAWPSPVSDTYGLQPSTSLETEVTAQIGAANLDVTVSAVDTEDSTIILTCQIPLNSPAGTKTALTAAAESDAHIYKILNVQVANGTALDAFKVQFNPIRDIAL